MTFQCRTALMSVLLSIVVVIFFFMVSIEQRATHPRPLLTKHSLGTKEDPHARWRYEFEMLRDPKTGSIPPGIRQKELAFAASFPSREQEVLKKGASVGITATWTPRGPYNVGGRTRALAIDISNENIILAGGVSGGMWRSTNGGSSWMRTTDLSLSIQSVTCIAQDKRAGKTNIWYYGTGEFRGNSASGGGNGFYHGDGIYKSTDGGVTWNVLASTVTNRPQSFDNFFDYVWNIVTDRSNTTQDEVYAATYGIIWRSTDGGSTWAIARGSTSSPFSPLTDVAITSTGVVYATLSSGGSSAGIWRSPDGISWTSITPSGWPSVYNRVVIGIAPSNENIVYFLAETPGTGKNDHQLWRYNASTGTWVDHSSNLPAEGPPVGDFDSQNSYDLVVSVKPDDENFVLIGGTNLYRSTDGFATSGNTTWIGGYATANDISQYPNHHPDQHAIVFLPSNPNVVLSGHDGGISRTTNIGASSVSWSALNTGYFTTQFYAVAMDNATAGNNVVIGGMQDNGTWFTNSSQASANWVELSGGDGGFCAIADGRSRYYVSSQNGNMYRFTLASDGTLLDWTRITPTGATGYLFINPFTLDPNEQKRMYLAAGQSIWRNSDLTAIPSSSNSTTSVNWDSISTSTVSSGKISALAVSKQPANRLYYGTSNGAVYRIDNAHSGNPSRMTITGSSFPADAYVSCIAVDPMNADNVMVVFSNYNVHSLFWSTNGGSSWTTVGGTLEQNPPGDGTGDGPSVRWATILPLGQTTVYIVGTSVGVYSTTALNGMSTVWTQEGASVIGKVVVPMVISRAIDGFVVAGTHANGIYAATFSTGVSSVEQVGEKLPTSFALLQNYPNPFNPSTSIQFTVPREGPVRLWISDAAGRTIRTLIHATRTAGKHSVLWDGRDDAGNLVSSGVYFYTLESAFSRSTRKMTLLR